ncbi:MAG: SH3 domain-containing protein, partial [Acidobacteria bacterium]|nr:SH3 domain-containing protein [Acidobacteriota bacterium]
RQTAWANELVKVLSKATQNNPKERHQSVTEFWQDLSVIKLLADAEDSETVRQISERPHTIPQPHVARGYTPLAPQRPRFNTSQDLKINPNLTAGGLPLVVKLGTENQIPIRQPQSIENKPVREPEIIFQPKPKRQRSFLRRFAVFVIFIGLFAGILFTTHNYLRGRGILPEIRNPFKQQFGTANGDVYLRSSPNTDKSPVGIVTKDSRLKIVGSQDNWYEVDIIEQGDPEAASDSAKHGWVSGKYVNVQE